MVIRRNMPATYWGRSNTFKIIGQRQRAKSISAHMIQTRDQRKATVCCPVGNARFICQNAHNALPYAQLLISSQQSLGMKLVIKWNNRYPHQKRSKFMLARKLLTWNWRITTWNEPVFNKGNCLHSIVVCSIAYSIAVIIQAQLSSVYHIRLNIH